MTQQRSGAEPTTSRATDSRRRAFASRPVLAISLGVSVVVHALVLVWYPGVMRTLQSDEVLQIFLGEPSQQGVDVIRLLDLETALILERPDEPAEVEVVEEPEEVAAEPVIDDLPGGALPDPPPTGAERLQPRLRDTRIWAPVDPALTELTLEQREELLLAGRLEAWYDSVAAAEAAAAAFTDWTFTDAAGKRWGVSPGKIHLGDLTLPLPIGFGTPVGKRDEVNRRAWEWEEITRQGARAEVEDSWKERSRAIRERRDRERAAQADTTRGGG